MEDLPELSGDNEEDDEGTLEEVPSDTCLRSEFIGMRRMMIILSHTDDDESDRNGESAARAAM